jgi:antitoxin CptB
VNTTEIDPKRYDRIRWHARRGLLENDILLTRYFDVALMDLSESELQQLDKLLHLGDNELLDILMERKLCDDATLQQIADSIIAASKGKLNTNTLVSSE